MARDGQAYVGGLPGSRRERTRLGKKLRNPAGSDNASGQNAHIVRATPDGPCSRRALCDSVGLGPTMERMNVVSTAWSFGPPGSVSVASPGPTYTPDERHAG